jgi:hypothetical protein
MWFKGVCSITAIADCQDAVLVQRCGRRLLKEKVAAVEIVDPYRVASV